MNRRMMLLAGLSASGCANVNRSKPIEVAENAITPPRDFCIRKNSKGEWYWTLRGANSKPIAVSEGYKNKSDCEHAIEIVRLASEKTPVSDDCPSPR